METDERWRRETRVRGPTAAEVANRVPQWRSRARDSVLAVLYKNDSGHSVRPIVNARRSGVRPCRVVVSAKQKMAATLEL